MVDQLNKRRILTELAALAIRKLKTGFGRGNHKTYLDFSSLIDDHILLMTFPPANIKPLIIEAITGDRVIV